jgi:hypothetical protein
MLVLVQCCHAIFMSLSFSGGIGGDNAVLAAPGEHSLSLSLSRVVVLSLSSLCYLLFYRIVLCCGRLCRVVLSCLVLSCRVVSCLVLSCRVFFCRGLPCRVVSYRVVSLSFLVVSCHLLFFSCHVLSCLVLSYVVSSSLALPCVV